MPIQHHVGYRHLSLRCRCGQAPVRIDEVGLTDDHQLVIHWWCEECKRVVYTSKPLAECWRDCPAHEPRETRQAPAIDRFDDHFLKSLGIRLQDD